MKRRTFLEAVSSTSLAASLRSTSEAAPSRNTALRPTSLLCELMEQPHLAIITNPRPRFGWVVNDSTANAMQSAYQILVAASREAIDRDRGDAKRAASWRHPSDFWDSGKIMSAESVIVPYRGKPLAAEATFWWKVRTWNERGQVSAFSQPQQFRTGRISNEYATTRYPLELQEIAPLRVVKKGDGHYFIEFAKAAFGTLRFLFNDGKAGDVNVELSEHRSALGEVWRPTPADPRARSSIGYLRTTMHFSGGREAVTLQLPERNRPAREELPPGIASVMPFRFVELTGCPNAITKDNVRQLGVFYHFSEESSRFVSSDKTLNDIWDLCKYTMKATSFCGVYIDGHRERLPYEADAYINQLGHYCVDREFTLARHSHEWLITHPTWPTEWITHSVLMAWTDYMQTGDDASLRRYYADLEAKTLSALARDDGLIGTTTVPDAVLQSIHFNGKLRDIVDWPLGERDGYDMRPINTVVNAFHCEALNLMSRIAEALGKIDDAKRYHAKAERAGRALREKLFDAQRGLFVDGEGSTHASLHANMFPLAFGLVPAAHRRRVTEFIKSKGMACSVYGSQYLMEALYRAGESDAAFALLTSRAERSWAHMIDVGTTITLEAWDNRFKPNQDWNHAWGAAPANLIPRWLIGVRPLEAGFRKVQIQPQPGPLEHADLTLPTIRGPIRVAFDNQPGKSFVLHVSLPANAAARVCVPQCGRDDANVRVDGKMRMGVVESGNACIDAIGSGEHVIER